MTRPDYLLVELLAEHPKLQKFVELSLDEIKEDGLFVPDEIFLPFNYWAEIAAFYEGEESITWDVIPKAAILQALGTWRYCKGVYRIPPTLFKALNGTDIPEKIPMVVFRYLPEKCLYIENTLELSGDSGFVYGWFVYFSYAKQNDFIEICILEDNEDGSIILVPFVLQDEKTIIENIAINGEKYAELRNLDGDVNEARKLLLDRISPALKALLYLCSDNPEIDDNHEPSHKPREIAYKRSKGQVRLFEPPKTRVWNIGSNLARSLDEGENHKTQGRNPLTFAALIGMVFGVDSEKVTAYLIIGGSPLLSLMKI